MAFGYIGNPSAYQPPQNPFMTDPNGSFTGAPTTGLPQGVQPPPPGGFQPITPASAAAGGFSQGQNPMGGGWTDSWVSSDPSAKAMQSGLEQGLTGQDLVNYVNGQDPSAQLAYYPGSNTYGAATGWYVAPNPSNPNQYDIIQRGGGGGGSNPALGSFTPNIPTSDWSPDPRTNELYSLLDQRATQNIIPSPNDPVIKAQTNAFSAAQQRQMRQYLQGQAETAGPISNLGAETRAANEKVAQNVGAEEATLMQNELTARRQEVQDALTQMGSFLSDQQRLDLQNKLAIMDNLLGQAGLQQGAYQFDQNLNLNTSPLAG